MSVWLWFFVWLTGFVGLGIIFVGLLRSNPQRQRLFQYVHGPRWTMDALSVTLLAVAATWPLSLPVVAGVWLWDRRKVG